MAISEDLATIREDVSYIKAKIEAIPDHEARLRVLERFRYAVPSASLLGLAVAVATAAITFTH